EIVVGFRTPAGVVTTVQSFKTMQLPRMVRGKPGAWDPMVCMHWGAGLLRELKVLIDNARGDIVSDTSVWRARFVPGKGVSVAVLEGRELEEVVNGEERVGFLPRWYWDTWREASQGRRTHLASVI
ncbi:Decapping and exoribonuclease protein, partial [Psilocybe cubensis]